MQILVCSFHEIPLFYQKGITDLISIGAPGERLPPINGLFGHDDGALDSVLRLEFDDVENSIQTNFEPPKEGHIKKLLAYFDFVSNINPNAKILIHCYAGISRSTAAALIYFALAKRDIVLSDFDSVWNELLAIRPQANPNTLMIELADKLLNFHGALRDGVLKKLNLK